MRRHAVKVAAPYQADLGARIRTLAFELTALGLGGAVAALSVARVDVRLSAAVGMAALVALLALVGSCVWHARSFLRALERALLIGDAPHEAALKRVRRRETRGEPLALVLRAFERENPERVGWWRVAWSRAARTPPSELLLNTVLRRCNVVGGPWSEDQYPMVAVLNQRLIGLRTLLELDSLVLFDDEWKPAVSRLIRHCSAIIVLMDETSEGLDWELEEIETQGLQIKTILLAPRDAQSERLTAMEEDSSGGMRVLRFDEDDDAEEVAQQLLSLLWHPDYSWLIESPFDPHRADG